MSATTLLVAILPIVVFVILDIYATPKVAIGMSVLAAIAVGIVNYLLLDDWDHSITAEIVLFLIFGVISLKMKNKTLFKFQPVAMGLALSAFLLWQEIFYQSYFLRAATLMAKLNPELQPILESQQMQEGLSRFSQHAIPAFFVHALILAWVAIKKGTVAWGIWRAAIWPILIVIMIFDMRT